MTRKISGNPKAPSDASEDLKIRLRHLENDFALTRKEYEDAAAKYLVALAEIQLKNAEHEALRKNLEIRVQERTAMLASANLALEQEIAKQRRTETALREAEERTRLLVKFLPVLLLVIGTNGAAKLAINKYARRVLGYEPDHGGAAVQFADLAGTALDTGKIIREALLHGVYDHECMLPCNDGRTIPVHLVVVPQPDRSGHVEAFYGFAEDITERRRTEQETRRHNEEMARAGKLIALGTLVAGVAHEMNNPNNLIMLSVPVLKKWFNQLLCMAIENMPAEETGAALANMREDIPRLLAGVEEGARRMRDIVKDLREFAMPNDPGARLAMDVNQQVAAAVNLLQSHIKTAARNFEVVYGRDLPLIRGQPGQARQLVVNLIKNACESLNGPEGWVKVATRFDNLSRDVIVEVQDNGAGIQAEDIPHVCDPFFTTRREQGAMGLGLAISAGVARTHNGSLCIDSEPGRGTRVTVRFPLPQDTVALQKDATPK